MKKQISSKIVALTFGVLTISFLAAFYVVAWQEPTSAPPSDNVAAPLNTGSVGQSKEGGLILNTGGAATALIIDNGEVCIADECKSTWPVGIPSGMIAMFDASCPAGWTRFAALDGRFARGTATYGGTGGNDSITLSVGQLPPHQHTVIGRDTDTLNHRHQLGYGGENELSIQPYPGWTVTKYEVPTSQTGNGSAINIMPRYLNVIWCKKN